MNTFPNSPTGPLAALRRRSLPLRVGVVLVALWLAFTLVGVVVGAVVALLKLVVVLVVAAAVAVAGVRVLARR